MDRACSATPWTQFTPTASALAVRNWLLAAVVTLLLISVMSQLITTDYQLPQTKPSPPIADVHLPKLIPTKKIYHRPEIVDDPQPQPKWPRNKETVDPGPGIFTMEPPKPGKFGKDPALVSRDPLPVFKPAPRYPSTALRRGLEGYVVVEFSIGTAGNVLNPRIVGGYDNAGNATDVFNRAALAAVARFKYQPQLEGGEPTVRHGVRNRIRFTLAD
ncbi:energy transducer TonB [Microbulbifer sp. 2201CG32-9]|uniref:energy transducer TonB n=1 Tax=Microbulbifer sp. 2201CG32-9 TaxID=3232309 RepID=UPI00345B56CB